MAENGEKECDAYITWEVKNFSGLCGKDSGFADISNSFYMPDTVECEWQLELVGYPKQPLDSTMVKGQKRDVEVKLRLIERDRIKEEFQKPFSVVIVCRLMNSCNEYYGVYHSRETFCSTKNTSWCSQKIDSQSLLKKLKGGALKIQFTLELLAFSRCDIPSHKVSLDLHDSLQQMLKDGTLTDIAFVDANGEETNVHQCVMASRCPTFKYLVKADDIYLSDVDGRRRIYTDLDKPTMAKFIGFAYTGELSFTSCGPIVFSLFRAAINYNMPDLKKVCEDFLILNLNISNCLDVLIFADDCEEPLLKKRTLEFISTNREHFLEEDSFLSVEKGRLLSDILSYTSRPWESKVCLS